MTFFATTGASSASSDYDETFAQAVIDGHEIGNHTAHHCYADLSECTSGSGSEDAASKIEECNEYIVGRFGQDSVWTMASPYGDNGWNALAEDYFFLNRGVGSGRVEANDSTNPFTLPAIMVAEGETESDFIDDIDTTYSQSSWHIFCFHTIFPTSQSWQHAGVEIEDIRGSIQHAKALEDMWIDSMVNIGAYWIGQKVVSEVTPTTSGDDTTWEWSLPDHFPPGKYLRFTVDGGTLVQDGEPLVWSSHGYYEVSLDVGSLTISP